jgi:ABC-type oligopeptide transport system substrate-binding subunit
MLRPIKSLLVPLFAMLGAIGAGPAIATDLTIGIGADVTAIDPHYHNVTPNNNVAAHIFDYLVLRDERQKPIPGLAESWRTVDPLTWEFKLRKGVKFHDGSEFTAPVHDPLPDRRAVPADANRHDAGRDHFRQGGKGEHRGLQQRQGRDRNRTIQASALCQGRSHRAGTP